MLAKLFAPTVLKQSQERFKSDSENLSRKRKKKKEKSSLAPQGFCGKASEL